MVKDVEIIIGYDGIQKGNDDVSCQISEVIQCKNT